MDFLKAEHIAGSKWRVLAIPFGGEFKDGKDSDTEFFSIRTDPYGPYKGIMRERPAVFHHGADPDLDQDVIGIQDDLELDEKVGWWGNLWLDRSHRYHAQIDALLRAGKMYGSSGAVGHFVKKNRTTGEILVWPHVEQTLTPTPANRLSRVLPVKAVAHFETLGLSLPPDLDSSSADLHPDLATAADAARLRARGIATAVAAAAKAKHY